MTNTRCWIFVGLLSAFAAPALAQSFRVQCPTSTITHPADLTNVNAEPAYTAPTTLSTAKTPYQAPTANVNGAIKCQQISGGDGYATMGDGTQTYMFSFGPLSGLADIASGIPGTESPATFNTPQSLNSLKPPFYSKGATPLLPGDPATTIGPGAATLPTGWMPNGMPYLSSSQLGTLAGLWNGAVGLAPNVAATFTIYDISESNLAVTNQNCAAGNVATVVLNEPSPFALGDSVTIGGTGAGYDGQWTVCAVNVPNAFFSSNYAFQFTPSTAGLPDVANSSTASAASSPVFDGHVDPRQIMDVAVMNGNIPAPLMAMDEDDEFFLTLTNVGMIMRPDLFEQHTVHFHGYPNASAFYDGVPDASVAIQIGGSFTYYYLAPDAGTYFWHCHITPPEHLQMGMVGQLYVRPRQNRVPTGMSLHAALVTQQGDLRTACNSGADVLCSTPVPPDNGVTQGKDKLGAPQKYAYNDGDGSTAYDVEYPLQMHGFDPNFHFVGMTFNPEGFADMKDKYFLLNGRSYPDTVTPGPLQTQSSDGVNHFSQPLPAIINIPAGGKALLRISELNVSEYHTLASLGIRMHVVGWNAKLLRDQAGNNQDYYTNSITMGGGESADVILDASNTTLYPAGSVFYLYTANLDHLSNDAENFGGQMTEVHIN